MSFFERAKAAANDLAAKADAEIKKAGISTPGGTSAMGGAGSGAAERALRDLGVLSYLEATGRPASPRTGRGSWRRCTSSSRPVGSASSA